MLKRNIFHRVQSEGAGISGNLDDIQAGDSDVQSRPVAVTYSSGKDFVATRAPFQANAIRQLFSTHAEFDEPSSAMNWIASSDSNEGKRTAPFLSARRWRSNRSQRRSRSCADTKGTLSSSGARGNLASCREYRPWTWHTQNSLGEMPEWDGGTEIEPPIYTNLPDEETNFCLPMRKRFAGDVHGVAPRMVRQ